MPEIRGERPPPVLRDSSALLAVREQCCLRRELSARNGHSVPARCGSPGRRVPGNPPISRNGMRSPAPPANSGRRPGPVRGEHEIRGRDDQEEEDGEEHGRPALSNPPPSPDMTKAHATAPSARGSRRSPPGRREHEKRQRYKSAGRRSREGRRVDRAGPKPEEREWDRHRGAGKEEGHGEKEEEAPESRPRNGIPQEEERVERDELRGAERQVERRHGEKDHPCEEPAWRPFNPPPDDLERDPGPPEAEHRL